MEAQVESKNARNYDLEARDNEGRKYAYNFDFDVMHHYMIMAMKPFFTSNDVLELGSNKGEFTKRLLPLFSNITCVEASAELSEQAALALGDKIALLNGRFEDVDLAGKFSNVIITHVLEHLDDPVFVLKRIATEWLLPGGRLFVVCPNANAPSRQIAVKMGLISHNSAVTDAEREHGHRITYTFDTLERDVRAAGLQVIDRRGIFFKALANFQWDRLLNTDIISPAYLDGCYMLGQQYPDLCSSIMLVCENRD